MFRGGYREFSQFLVEKSVVLVGVEAVVGLDQPQPSEKVRLSEPFVEGFHTLSMNAAFDFRRPHRSDRAVLFSVKTYAHKPPKIEMRIINVDFPRFVIVKRTSVLDGGRMEPQSASGFALCRRRRLAGRHREVEDSVLVTSPNPPVADLAYCIAASNLGNSQLGHRTTIVPCLADCWAVLFDDGL